jgi:hypothetical protein
MTGFLLEQRLDPNFAVSGAFWKYLVHDRVFIRAARATVTDPRKRIFWNICEIPRATAARA